MKIKLSNIKKIKSLTFELPSEGTWLLTGLNGSGKTSLFAAIHRIKQSNAFQRFFKTSPLEHRLDTYNSAEVEYEINGEVVKYKYGGQRWRATPRKNSELLETTNYEQIEYISATADRIEPFADEIKPRKLKNASDDIKNFMKFVLGDEKWENLKYVNTRRGIGSEAYLVQYKISSVNYYYSEKSFSLGELCILKLAKKICAIGNNSLLLIDEVEMALHPQAQVRFLQKIKEIAAAKNLTVLISSHSAALIKNFERNKVFHLTSDSEGNVDVVKYAFPAQILGEIAFDDELNADFIFYVEDKQAKYLLEQLIGKYMSIAAPDYKYQPLYKVVPVGGFVQVVEMFNSSSTLFPSYVKKYAILDEDVKTESLAKARSNGDQKIINLFARANEYIKYLPCTPECGLMNLFEDISRQNVDIRRSIDSMFAGHRINIIQLTSAQDYQILTKENIRDRAKDRIKNIVKKIELSTGIDQANIYKTFYGEYVKHKYAGQQIGQLRQMFGPIFNS